MAAPRLVIDGNNSRAAIMINSDPGSTAANIADPAFADPLGHFGSWKWAGHPNVDYLGIVSVKTGTVNLASSSGWTGVDSNGSGGFLTWKKTLVAHGQPFTPILVGYMTIGGKNIPISGDFWVGPGTQFNIYADATNIIIFGTLVVTNPSSVPFTIYICNMGISSGGALVRPPLNTGWNASGSRLRCGRFDTAYGYFYKNASGAIPIVRGQSTKIGIGREPDSSIIALGFSYNVNGYAFTKRATKATTDDLGDNWPGTDTSAASVVKISAAMPASAPAFQASPGRIRFGNVLDSDRSMFLISNAILNKTITVPSLNWSNSHVTDQTLNFVVGTVHPNASDVLGLTTVLGKTYSLGGTSLFTRGFYPMHADRYQWQAGQTTEFAAAVYFYFTITGTQLIMTVKRKFPYYPPNDGHFASFSIKVNALVGAFDY